MSEYGLSRLAALAGIAPGYWDVAGTWHEVSAAGRLEILAAMRLPAATEAEMTESLRRLEQMRFGTVLPGLLTCRTGGDGGVPAVPLWVPAKQAGRAAWTLALEDGGVLHGSADLDSLPTGATETVAGEPVRQVFLPLHAAVPWGYHRLTLEACGTAQATTVAAAPWSSFLPEWVAQDERRWGLAAHVYQLRGARDRGAGTFADLAALGRVAGGLGAAFLALNPLHALFPQWPALISPYFPSSRRFLNPLYVDLDQVSGSGPKPRGTVNATKVDYPKVLARQSKALDKAWLAFKARGGDPAFDAFAQQGGEALARYATFQAIQEVYPDLDWPRWPVGLRHPVTSDVQAFADANQDRIQAIMWQQWLADDHLEAATSACAQAGMDVGLYRDLAVGVSPAGADAWMDQDVLALGARVGAPPDAFTPHGQDWGAPPFDPHRLRQQGYGAFIDILRANMRHAGAIRIDHVMALARLYWVPSEGGPKQGTYVSYPLDDLTALVALESHRNRCMVIGEDLGTVQEGLRERLDVEAILSYRLFMFERWEDGLFKRPDAYPVRSIATATTHDLPTLPGFWRGSDLPVKHRLGFLGDDTEALSRAEADRDRDKAMIHDALRDQALLPADAEDAAAVVTALYAYLARTPSLLLQVSLDDVLGALEQLNLPGTVDTYPNWQHRLPVAVEDLANHPGLAAVIDAINQER